MSTVMVKTGLHARSNTCPVPVYSGLGNTFEFKTKAWWLYLWAPPTAQWVLWNWTFEKQEESPHF